MISHHIISYHSICEQLLVTFGSITSFASNGEGRVYESTTARMSTTFYAGGHYDYDNEDWQWYESEDEGAYCQNESWKDSGDYGADVWDDAADWSTACVVNLLRTPRIKETVTTQAL